MRLPAVIVGITLEHLVAVVVGISVMHLIAVIMRLSLMRFVVGQSKAKAAAAKGPNSAAAKNKRASVPNKQTKAAKGSSKSTPKAAPAEKAGTSSQDNRDSLIGRCVKKDFETDSGVKAYAGWVIGVHSKKKWYACSDLAACQRVTSSALIPLAGTQCSKRLDQ